MLSFFLIMNELLQLNVFKKCSNSNFKVNDLTFYRPVSFLNTQLINMYFITLHLNGKIINIYKL